MQTLDARIMRDIDIIQAAAELDGKCTHPPTSWEREGTEGDCELICTVCKKPRSECRPEDYLNSTDAALRLVEKLATAGFETRLVNYCTARWHVVLSKSGVAEHHEASESLARAITLACLKAAGKLP